METENPVNEIASDFEEAFPHRNQNEMDKSNNGVDWGISASEEWTSPEDGGNGTVAAMHMIIISYEESWQVTVDHTFLLFALQGFLKFYCANGGTMTSPMATA